MLSDMSSNHIISMLMFSDVERFSVVLITLNDADPSNLEMDDGCMSHSDKQ